MVTPVARREAVAPSTEHAAFVESFNGQLRDDLSNKTQSTALGHAREALATCRVDYSAVRPHRQLGNLTPAEYSKLSVCLMQRHVALELVGGSAPRPVASSSCQGAIERRTLLIAR